MKDFEIALLEVLNRIALALEQKRDEETQELLVDVLGAFDDETPGVQDVHSDLIARLKAAVGEV